MDGYLDHLQEKAAQAVDSVGEDFIGGDGLLYCGACGQRKQLNISLWGRPRIVPCLCRCGMEEKKRREEESLREEEARRVVHLKSVGLTDRRFFEWRFAMDNGKNPKMPYAQEYVKRWPEMKEKNLGLLLTGPVGTGKSFMAGCIANALMENGIPVMMTNFPRIFNELTKYGADRNQVVDALADYPLLILDDLGIERNSEFATEQVYSIIDRRYCSKRPLIVTTNLTQDEMKNADLAHQRIYSRIFEMCLTVVCNGEDLRLGEEENRKKGFLGEERYGRMLKEQKRGSNHPVTRQESIVLANPCIEKAVATGIGLRPDPGQPAGRRTD